MHSSQLYPNSTMIFPFFSLFSLEIIGIHLQKLKSCILYLFKMNQFKYEHMVIKRSLRCCSDFFFFFREHSWTRMKQLVFLMSHGPTEQLFESSGGHHNY